ncbi:uncharacterized protein [Amphiura filiformis]|uniref:uncharacterized protein n=1 Tax=Amphiura filiformis TaxID=82378 RepID=UPI003B219C65
MAFTTGDKRQVLPLHKIIMVGSQAARKSALTLKFVYDEYVEGYDPTIEDSYRKKVLLDGEDVQVDIIDTAGMDTYAAIRDLYLKSGDGFMSVFAVTDRDSYDVLPGFRDQILRVKTDSIPEEIPILLVGTEGDIPSKRQVSQKEAEDIAAAWGVSYVEVSAKTGQNVEEAFFRILRMIRDQKAFDNPSTNENIPSEILKQGKMAIQAYRHASYDGTKPVYRTRIMLVGQERVGKTSLMNTLIGHKYNSSQPITEGVDTTTRCLVPTLKTGITWQMQRGELSDRSQQIQKQYVQAMRYNIAKQLHTAVPQNIEEPVRKRSPDEKRIESGMTDAGGKSSEAQASSTAKKNSGRLPREIATVSGLPADVLKDLNKELKKHSPEKYVKEEESDLEFQFWDFAGQDVYYNTHQVFLNRRAIFLLIFDVSKNLNEQAKVASVSYDQTVSQQSRFHDFTGTEFLDFWLHSIYAYAALSSEENMSFTRQTDRSVADDGAMSNSPDAKLYKSPPVLIIGTHRGDIGKHHGVTEQVNIEKATIDQIHGTIKGKPYEEHVVRTVHYIENNPKLQTKEDKKMVKDLRSHIYDIALKEPYMGERIPVRWLLFEKSLLDLAVKKTRHISLDQAKLQAKEYGIIDDNELLTVLRFLHDLGTIIYFGTKEADNTLKNMIILDPQWLIDVFKTIITVKPNEKQLPAFRDSWALLGNKGILKDSLINNVWKKNLHLKDNLLALMEKFDLICPQYPEEECGEDDKSFYVPACLQPAQSPLEKESKEFTDGSFYLNFMEYLPDAVFNYLTIYAARWCQKSSGIPPKLFYRLGRFTVGTQRNRHSFRLEMRPARPAAIKVVVERKQVYGGARETVKTKDTGSPEMCEKVMAFIETTMTKVTNKWARGIQFQLSVACVACRDKRKALHLLPLQKDQMESEVYCEFTEDHIYMRYYWKQLRSTPEATSDMPEITDIDLKSIIRQLGRDDLQHLYVELEISHQDVEKAEYRANSRDIELQAMEVLRFWRDMNGTEASRSAILNALTECENQEAVENLEEIWSVG